MNRTNSRGILVAAAGNRSQSSKVFQVPEEGLHIPVTLLDTCLGSIGLLDQLTWYTPGQSTYTSMQLKVKLASPSRQSLAAFRLSTQVIKEVNGTSKLERRYTGVCAA